MTHAGGTVVERPEPSTEQRTRTGRRPWLAAAAAVGVPTAVFAAHAALYSWWVVDDAAITWAYARSLVAGAGPVLQPGVPPAEGWSNPAWLAVFVVVTALGLPLVATTKALALVCAAGTTAALWSAARAVLPARSAVIVAAAAGTVAALVPSYVAWAVSGLETPLYVLVVAWLAAMCLRAGSGAPWVAVLAGALAAAAALTRPDGLVYAAAFPLAALAMGRWRGLRPAVVSLAVFVVPVAAYFGWRRASFGTWLPNTAIAKAQGLPTTVPAVLLVEYAGLFLAAVAVLAVAAWWYRPGARAQLVALAVPVVLALGAYCVLERDWMGQFRFAAPVWPVAALLGAVAVAVLGRALPVVVLAVAVWASLGVSWASAAWTFHDSPTVPVCLVAQIDGQEVNAYADAGGIASGTVLVPDVGGAALVGRMRVVDLAGLTEPTIARYWQSGDIAGLRGYVFDQVRPTFVAAHGSWATQSGLDSDPRLPADYVLVADRGDGQVWVRRDAVTPASLAAMQGQRPAQAAAEDQVRHSPRARCALTG